MYVGSLPHTYRICFSLESSLNPFQRDPRFQRYYSLPLISLRTIIATYLPHSVLQTNGISGALALLFSTQRMLVVFTTFRNSLSVQSSKVKQSS